MKKKEELFRRDLAEQQAADFIHQQGRAAYLKLPFAPPPPQEVVEGLKRSTMTAGQRQAFVREWGREHFDRLPE